MELHFCKPVWNILFKNSFNNVNVPGRRGILRACSTFKKTVYCEKIVDSHALVRNDRDMPHLLHWGPPIVIACKAMIHCHNSDTDKQYINLVQISLVLHVLVFVSVYFILCSFIICIPPCDHDHSQGPEQFHCKDPTWYPFVPQPFPSPPPPAMLANL